MVSVASTGCEILKTVPFPLFDAAVILPANGRQEQHSDYKRPGRLQYLFRDSRVYGVYVSPGERTDTQQDEKGHRQAPGDARSSPLTSPKLQLTANSSTHLWPP